MNIPGKISEFIAEEKILGEISGGISGGNPAFF